MKGGNHSKDMASRIIWALEVRELLTLAPVMGVTVPEPIRSNVEIRFAVRDAARQDPSRFTKALLAQLEAAQLARI